MGKTITIRKGYDIKIKSPAEKKITELPFSDIIALKPQNFPTVIPKVVVEVGQEVVAGQALVYDKNNPNLPVMDEDMVIGILSIGDIVNSIMKEQQEHIDFLEQYITNA